MTRDHAQRNGSVSGHARAFVKAGLCALPAVRRGDTKHPAVASWKRYQDRLPSEDEVGSWFGEAHEGHDRAVCIVCGAVSGNLEMIDFDNWEGGGAEAFAAWRDAVDAQAPGLVDRLVIETTPSGGRHIVYRCETPICGNTKLAQRWIETDDATPVVLGAKEYIPRRDPATGAWAAAATIIETRGEGGLFLCAPSPGYAVVRGDLADPPLITADERDVLLGAAWALDETPMPVVGAESTDGKPCDALRPGDDFNERGDVRELLTRHGWALVKTGDNEHWRRPGKPAGTSATLKGRVFYVFSSNAPPFEPQTGYAPFAVYALLEHGGDYANAASALAAAGYGSQAPDTRGVDLSGFTVDPTEPARPDTSNDHGLMRPEPVAVDQLIASYPRLREPVIHGLIRAGETMNVIASPKTGKSWLTLDLAIAVATGRPWLGCYETEPGDVLIIDNELHRETSAHRIPRVAEARGVAMRELAGRVFVDNLRGRLQDIFTLGPYFEALEPGRFKVIVLDAFYRFMPAGGDENDNGTMAGIYNRIDAFADGLGCCFVLIHHSTKGSQSGKSVTDVGAGAGAQSRATDTHLVLRPHEEHGVVVLDAAVRSWKPVEPMCLRWDFPVWNQDRALDPADLKHETRKQKQADAMTTAGFVAAFVRPEPATRSEIIERATEARVSRWRADALLRAADREGLMVRRGDGLRNDPFTYQLPGESGRGGTP